MPPASRFPLTAVFFLLIGAIALADEPAVPLPPGISAAWDLANAEREATDTRERICINGLWRWQPARDAGDRPPDDGWGYFKVPGCWPGITDYMQKDCQTLFAHPDWDSARLAGVKAAWYQREITIPADWKGRRITVTAECVNSLATLFFDDQRAGEIRFPGGELDLTPHCDPGRTYRLSLHVAALPLKGVMLSYTDTNSAREVEGRVARRGLCGDVFLVSTSAGPRMAGTRINTSVRDREVTFDVALEQLSPDTDYLLHVLYEFDAPGVDVTNGSRKTFRVRDLKDGRIALSVALRDKVLWDVHTPQNMWRLNLALSDVAGNVFDIAFRERVGFREFWIDGRDFYLNGSRIFLCGVPLDNAQIGAAWASYDGAKESLLRLKSFGINFVYTHNYGCEPGSHLSFREILRAADDVGMLVALSQPHFSQYDWQAPDADQNNGYARHAAFYVQTAGNHPSVVAYSMSHNACGYGEDMNPDLIDGLREPRTTSNELRNSGRALRAEAIVKGLDPQRIVYHHAGGNISAMHTINFYPNFVPIQELSDWFGHWAAEGVKPVFTCEYGAPFSWDWAMYRGWYKGEREFGSARVPWDFCHAEWNAQFLGDRAFQISDAEKENLRWEAARFKTGRMWQRWDYPHDLSSKIFAQRYEVMAAYLNDNWRSFRTWGVSGISPWEHGQYWTLRDGVDRGRKDLAVDWQHLQRPGFSADYIEQRYERMDIAYDRADWVATPAAEALLKNNQRLLGWIAGRPEAFTSKDHLFYPGETVAKQAIVVNNSRNSVNCDISWSLDLPQPLTGSNQVTVATGDQARVSLPVSLPDSLPPGEYHLTANFKFSTGGSQDDQFTIQVVPCPEAPRTNLKIAVWDPRGESTALLRGIGVTSEPVDASADLSPFNLLIIGKGAMTVDGPAPDIARVRDGLRVIMFEQTGEVLEQRLGFRIAEYGLRQVFPRVPDHPLLAGIGVDQLRDWRGDATLLPPQLTYTMEPRRGPQVNWCGISVPRLWRCGNRGNVASVLIEKPPRGDFLPIVDGGYSLQYSPLMEYREGAGMILFCQVDVTGRTGTDAAAELLARNILRYVSTWKPAKNRIAMYVGEAAGQQHLESLGIDVQPFDAERLTPDVALVVGPRADLRETTLTAFVNRGGRLLAVGLDEHDASQSLPGLQIRSTEHIAAYFDSPGVSSLSAGVGPADVHNRDPRKLGLVTGGATILGDGVLAEAGEQNIAICALAPWQFAGSDQQNLRKTFRRSSFLVSRLLANIGVAGTTPIIERFGKPADPAVPESRWQSGLYLDQPEEWDDPYRFFRW